MATFFSQSSIVKAEEVEEARRYLEHASREPQNRIDILEAIPRPSQPSFAPLATLSALLETIPGPWPVLHLQRTHNELWKLLPEDAKAGHASPDGQKLIDHVLGQCKSSYSSLLDLYHPSSRTSAIIDPESSRSASHDELARTISNFTLPISSSSDRSKPVVAISLPNGPLLAMTVLATATYYTAAPVAHGSGVGAEQFKADVLQSKSDAVIASAADVQRLGLRESWLEEAGITVLLVDLTSDMRLSVTDLDERPVNKSNDIVRRNTADDTGIMLFTSGTSGTRKLVPLSIHSMVCGVAMVEKSWGLEPSMRCLNQMPLNHVGGLIRNLFAPVFSGGSVICCSAFDANLFWDCVEDFAPTWYYASPSMHQVILEAGSDRPESVEKSRIQLICNAAGGLLPSLALKLRDTFSTQTIQCTVLPSYGMTECMPISTPPLDYKLDKTGTSGISVGPEICILNGRDERERTGEVGRICVRGAPVFDGYLKADNVIDKSCFNAHGWFDTGDMGYLDDEGFLYITGRSKEVINRGGELISPFEVEEAIIAAANKPGSPIYGRVSKALAFSVTHNVLQEVVGLAVATPDGAPRPCLRTIQEAVKSELSQVKLPVAVVYMQGGVPTNNNKVLRIKLADRLRLPEVSDSTPTAERHFEAACPPPNTALSVPIGSKPLVVSHETLQSACETVVPRAFDFWIKDSYFYPELVLAPKSGKETGVINKQSLLEDIAGRVHGYNIPVKIHQLEEPFVRDDFGDIDVDVVNATITKPKPSVKIAAPVEGSETTEATISRVFARVLSLPVEEVNSSSDFFELGGDSMGAGRLLNALRKEYPVRLPISVLFTNPKVHQLAQVIEEKLPNTSPESKTGNAEPALPPLLPGLEKTCSSSNPALLLLQLVPIVLMYPMRRALTWTVFIYMLRDTQDWPTNETVPGRLFDLVISISVGGIVTRIISPCLAIIFKWLVVGRYKQGLYPMWGSYHTRWWIVQKATATCGMGVFALFNGSRVLYHRLLGAKIGRNVTIQKGVTIGEWDLLTIEDNVVLERSIVRPFAAERNTTMYLGRIHIGANASVGLASVVAAGTTVPANACIGPNSSSWETDGVDEANRDLASNKIPPAHWALEYLVGLPLAFMVKFVGAVPWLASLTALVMHEPSVAPDMFRQVIIWFASPGRVSFHYLALAANVALGPFFFFFAFLVIKKLFDCTGGKIQPGRADNRSQWTKFRMQWMRTVMPAPQFHKLTELFGTHYDSTSVFARALGSRVGKRVYWPGTGPSIQDFDLLEIGDDVVFGSRSHLVTSDGTGSDYVRIKSGAMIADRVVLLPGVEVGDHTVMGSGALTKRNNRYADGTTWVGAKNGEAVKTSSSRTVDRESTGSTQGEDGESSPFGRAFYQGKANYRVWSQFEIFTYSTIIAVANGVFWNIGSVSAVQIVAYLFKHHNIVVRVFLAHNVWWRPIAVYTLFLTLIVGIMALQSIAVIAFIIAAKWILMGRRQPGNYDWDKSPYCQRWQLFLKLETFRRHCYGGHGILGLLTGTKWISLYFTALGAKIGKDCALFAGGLPSLMFTEPDLLTLGDRVCVDDASLVGHINTRGKFDLNPLSVGSRSVLRSGSRLLSGAKMEEDTCLLEHTLVMAGDVVDAGSTSQGWPAEDFTANRIPTMEQAQYWKVKA
ncbi:uncharacterized protein MYCFIDRAFT_36349 [Pseudocercospora fijiensis CIRAD86]|uniref:Carrier domain-containing protein n=1 Tax=Pseudocercospora fijiensis (strain CIRAD86) TaxID=383855 RepID=M3AEN5_PSEFD|nr:uncharacterized protein MYCFIDRAFT_36349 [Pseudocercospora fijiensis CIRAD86]EME83076.1 hypothetical protein MYCFIDRAFT_36349 [Pseudocercospora fijiensis CIRAD86]